MTSFYRWRIVLFASMTFLVAACAPESGAPARYGRHANAYFSAVHPNVQTPIEQLRPTHPRLLVTSKDFVRAMAVAARDPTARRWLKDIRSASDGIMRRPLLDWASGATLENARALEQRVMHLAFMYRTTRDMRYANRARDEMLAAAQAPDWKPQDFLITAETTTGMAVGYDWLFDALSNADRLTIADAIATKGLAPGRDAYDSGASWVHAHHNWNLVCNGGMMLGALAIYEQQPDLARQVIESARESVVNGLRAFAPDGGWEEGPTYWNYASRFACYLLSSLHTAMGVSFKRYDLPGFAQTGDFCIYTLGPTGLNFNFGDSDEKPAISPQMFWLAKTFDHPEYAAFERRHAADGGVMGLLWYQSGDNSILNRLPTAALFRGPEVATFRGQWFDRMTTWVGFKGGSAKAHHGHLDLGSFVMDALGQRWAIDLGAGNYNLPGYTGAMRWNYYRTRTEGHNTLSFKRHNQNLNAYAPIIAFHESPELSHAVVDLTSAYAPGALRVLRGIALVDRRDVLVQDEIDLRAASTVTWAMHTKARIKLDGSSAQLTLGGQVMNARILLPKNARFEAEAVKIPRPQNPARNVRKLVIRLPVNGPTTIAVQFTPGSATPVAIRIRPLSRWESDRDLGSAGAYAPPAQRHHEPAIHHVHTHSPLEPWAPEPFGPIHRRH